MQRRTDLTRRDVLRSMGLLGMLASAPPLLSGCGRSASPAASPGTAAIAVADVQRYLGGGDARPAVISAVRAFTTDLYQQIAAANPGNVICSPYSVAEALAMTRNGARASTASEMDHVLGIDDLQHYNEGMDSLALLINSRAGDVKRLDGSQATVAMDVANSLWGQKGERWEQPFLDALARYYGTGMRLVDYKRRAERARVDINAWVSHETNAKIPNLIPSGLLDELTRLVLVNAIYLKAPWEVPFEDRNTADRPFVLTNGQRISTPTMQDSVSAVVTEGTGWKAVRLPYAGRKLAMTVVVPSTSLEAIEKTLDATTLRTMISGSSSPQRMTLSLPKWKFRLTSELSEALGVLGMPSAFTDKADFSGLTRQEPLYIKAVQHEAFIAVDEKGTEAAAATAVVVEAESAEVPPPPFTVDRPFLFVIHDVDTATPLFIGRVTDPTQS